MGKKDSESRLVSFWNQRFKESMVQKADYTKRWQVYIDAYFGDYFKNEHLPDYKSNLVSNYIFSIIETIRPIMLDNDPKFQAMPRQEEGLEYSSDVQEALGFEWDRESMNTQMYRELITTLVQGTAVFFVPWDDEEKEVRSIAVNPFNIFPDPLATSVEDSDYIIYATYKNVEVLKQSFPEKEDELSGSQINYSELVYENDENARVDNQVLVLEVWTEGYEVYQDEEDDRELSDGGRVLTICPELGIVLEDKENPYDDGAFPFVLIKDYDIPGKFWGEGEVAQLLSPQQYMNELNNAIVDNAKTTANMPWIVDKNSGIKRGGITSQQGLVIRKNPGTEVRREQAPPMPGYVMGAVESYKQDMEQVSGVFDTLKGSNETGVYTAQGILALQEAGQARIRLKVKLLEHSLATLGQLWYSRMKQFWSTDRFIRTTRSNGTYEVKTLFKQALKQDYDIRITAGSTMPVNRGSMLDLMIRLSQTVMPDGQTLVDREAVVQYLPEEVKSTMLQRMETQEMNSLEKIQELEESLGQIAESLGEVAEESNTNDESTFEVIEEIMGAVEELNKGILQLQEKHDRMEEEQKKEEELNNTRNESYNEGFSDSESYASEVEYDPDYEEMTGDPLTDEGLMDTHLEEGLEPGIESMDGLGEDGEGMNEMGIPDEILQGLEELTDDELALLIEQNPEILDLIT